MGYFFISSIKQLMRTPVKVVLFTVLIMATAFLLVFSGAILSQTTQRIAAAENEFVTLGVVEQPEEYRITKPLWNSCREEIEMLDVGIYQDVLTADILNFDGANYMVPPETRPYYVAYLPEYIKSFSHSAGYVAVAEFTIKEKISETKLVVRLERFLYRTVGGGDTIAQEIYEGNDLEICTHNQPIQQRLDIGKRYIATLGFDQYSEEGWWDAESWVLFTGPFTTQVEASTHMAVSSKIIPSANNLYSENGTWSYIQPSWTVAPKFPELCYADEVTEDFYEEGGKGKVWLQWAEGMERIIKGEKNFIVLPVDALDILPSFHDKSVIIKSGRAITDCEFAAGDRVCLASDAFLRRNFLEIGDKIPLSLVYSTYGNIPWSDSLNVFGGQYSPLNSEGELYEPFWEGEYEIVGTFDMPFNEDFKHVIYTGKEIQGDSFIIPAKSVEVSDENNIAYYAPMNALSTSFIIPNGSIEEFDRKLQETVPEAAKLKIRYDDNGYTEVMDSLNGAKLSSMLLFFVALFAALAIIVLVLYFFVEKEKKRTAIERSLGMTKKQCRISLVSGIAIITLVASIIGSTSGAVLMENVSDKGSEEGFSRYSLEYSTWTRSEDAVDVELDVTAPWTVYVAVPVVFTSTVLVLAVLIVNRNLRIEPIYLLSTKG